MKPTVLLTLLLCLVACGKTKDELVQDYARAITSTILQMHRARAEFDRRVAMHFTGAPIDTAGLTQVHHDLLARVDALASEIEHLQIPDDPDCRLYHALSGEFVAVEKRIIAENLAKILEIVIQDFPPHPRARQYLLQIYQACQQGEQEVIARIGTQLDILGDKYGFKPEDVTPADLGPIPLMIRPSPAPSAP